MQGTPQYFDQVRLCAKRACSSLPDSGTESTESFLKLKRGISRKIQHADAQMFLVRQIAYEGGTKECKQAIRTVKNGDLSTWFSATQDIGTQTYMATTLAATLTKGSLLSPTLHALDVDKRATGKGTTMRAKHIPLGEKSSKIANNIIKAIIGLKTVNLNIMLMGDL
jgi:hypothetical protein